MRKFKRSFMSRIIGRKQEIEELQELYHSGKAEFVAVYGRRRVGKTYLIDETLGDHITFRHAGLSPVDDNNKQNLMKDQLQHFYQIMLLQTLLFVSFILPFIHAFPVPQYKVATKIKNKTKL